MLVLEGNEILEKQSKELVERIIRTLEVKFNKTRNEAVELVNSSRVYEDLISNPIGLHDSPEKWALIILTENEDLAAIDYFYKQ